MKRIERSFIAYILIIVLCSFSTLVHAQKKQKLEEKNILVLHSYHQGLEWTDNISKGIQSVFQHKTGVNLFFEYLDTKRNVEPEYFNALNQMYKVKAKQNIYSVIITCDNAAFDFMREYSNEYYPGVPVVYCGVNNLNTSLLSDLPNFFGYDEKVDYRQTINSIKSIFPERKNVLIINDNTLTGQAIRKELVKVLPQFNEELNFEIFSDFSIKELKDKVKKLDDSYTIYLLVINRDKEGNFISYKKGITTIQNVSNVPIFGSWDFYENKGLFGGKITRGFDQGKHAALLADEIIKNGVSKRISQFNKVVNSYVFDYREMERFDVSRKQLPVDSIILNEPDRNRYFLKSVLILSILLVLIIIVLSIRLMLRRRRAIILQKLVNEKTHQLKETNTALKDIIAKKDRFMSIMSHDLKSPFNSMLGFSELLNNEFDTIDRESQKKYINVIYKGIKHTYKLLENLLFWSYSQSGAIDFDPQKEDISQLTKEIIEVLSFSAERKSIFLINNLPDSLFLKADKNMLSTIIRNLISNAIKFTNRGGIVEIEAKEVVRKNTTKMLEFSVKDNGVGISEEVQSKLFDISEISSTKGTENEKGTGLGLILCKEFTERHNGTIWVESEPGSGSRFIFTIPLGLDIQ